MKQNFIKTTDKETADKFILCGFQLVSHVGNMYTFLNQSPKNFSFDEVDKKKYAYSNILSV
jgi:hypothetical protein